MEHFSEGDYIEHWENGVGRIIRIDEGSVLIDFLKRGNILVEKEKTAHFNKLIPSGLLAQMHEDLEHIHDLVKQESTGIIKLLIYDEDRAHSREIERSRIKSLLVRADPSDSGWRRDFGLVEQDNWKKWWANVSKKLVKDPWFDTSSKSVIILRDKPVSKAHNIYERFGAETQLDKKLSICEQLIKALNKDTDETILKDIKKFITDLIEGKPQKEISHFSILNAIQLSLKGIEVEAFNQKPYELTFSTLLDNKMPPSKKMPIYSFFKKLHNQNLFDHLVLYLHCDKKLREKIIKTFKGGKDSTKAAKGEPPLKALTQVQISGINGLKVFKRDLLESSLRDLMTLKDNKLITGFLSCILISESIDPVIKEAVSKVVTDFKMRDVIYNYLIEIQVVENKRVPFLTEFLDSLGPENAEWCLRNILLSEKSFRERPKLFLVVLKNLVSDSFHCIEITQKKRLIVNVADQFSDRLITDNIDLKLEISQILAEINGLSKSIKNTKQLEFINLAEGRQTNFSRRREALKVLIKSGLKADCQAIARNLITGINADEFVLLGDIFKSFPDTTFANELFELLIGKATFSEEVLCNAFAKFLKDTNLTKTFLEAIFVKENYSWQHNDQENLRYLVNNEHLAKEIIRFGLERITSGSENSINITRRLTTFYSPLVRLVLEDVNEFYLSQKALIDDEINKIKMECTEEIQEIVDKQAVEVRDAIDKTSQRYEEYLKRLVSTIYELEDIIKMVQEEDRKGSGGMFRKEMISRLSTIKEDIEGVLKRAKIIDRE